MSWSTTGTRYRPETREAIFRNVRGMKTGSARFNGDLMVFRNKRGLKEATLKRVAGNTGNKWVERDKRGRKKGTVEFR